MERANKEVKVYLRKFVLYKMDDWLGHLVKVEYSYNIRLREDSSFLLYQTVFGEISKVTNKKLIQRIIREEDTARNE
jgi:hypothetical protein